MLVSIALTAATVCTACTCTKRLDETQWQETWDVEDFVRDETKNLPKISFRVSGYWQPPRSCLVEYKGRLHLSQKVKWFRWNFHWAQMVLYVQ